MTAPWRRRWFRFAAVLAALWLPTVGAASLEEDVHGVLSAGFLQDATVAVHVVDAGSRAVIFTHNADLRLIPASNQKIVTAVAALDVLGRGYEFVTTLSVDGEIGRDGALHGDLRLRGGGDPTLGSPSFAEDALAQLDRWARLLQDRGLRHIHGDVVVDESLFDQVHVHPDWPANQIHRFHSAPVNAFMFHDNCIRVHVRPDAVPGRSAHVVFSPDNDVLRLQNTCRTGTGANTIWMERAPGSSTIRVGGEAKHAGAGWSGLVTVPDPAALAGSVFVRRLHSHGITHGGRVRVVAERGEASGRLVARRRASLDQVLEVMLMQSQNMYAEAVVKTLGAVGRGTGTWEAGQGVINDAMRARNWSEHEVAAADGSGYSRQNRLTAGMLCGLLVQMHGEAASFGQEPVLLALLPQAGAQGTMSHRLTASAYAGRVHAKSGYLARVSALSGYVRTRSGRTLAFCILLNDVRRGGRHDMHQVQDALVRILLDADL